MKHTISILLENEPGALSRVVGLFSQRGYNIETLSVAPTEDASLSRLTLTTVGDDQKLEQITKHLNRLIDVVHLEDMSGDGHLCAEVIFIKVDWKGEPSESVSCWIEPFGGEIVDRSGTISIVKFFGGGTAAENLLKTAGKIRILEVARSGTIGIHKGGDVLMPSP